MNSSGAPSRLVGWLAHPRAGVVVVACALLVTLPSLSLGFFADDYAFIDALEHRLAREIPWWDLYRLVPGNLAEVPGLIVHGELPWWTDLELRMHFARPIPSALLAMDHALFGRSAVLWHVDSLLWFGALLFAVNALFRRLLPPATATLGLFVFALSDAAFNPTSWLSARHYLLGTLFVTLGLLFTVQSPSEAWKPRRALALGAFAVALLCGEAALGGLALAFAYEVLAPSEMTFRTRLLRAWPFGGMVVVYLGIYALAGCGAYGGAGYLSPLAEPGRFIVVATTRFPVLLADAVLHVPAELATFGIERGLAVVGLVSALLAGILLRVVLPRATDAERGAVTWLLPGALVAMVAGVGGFPGARELMIPNLGLSPTLAVLLIHGLEKGQGAFVRRTATGLLALLHVGFAPLLLLGNQHGTREMVRATMVTAGDGARAMDSHGRLRILQASDPMVGIYAPAILASETDRSAACAAWVSGARADMVVERTGPRTFTLSPKGTTFLKGAFENLVRAAWHPLTVGYEQPICGAVVKVLALDEGLPSRIEVTADTDLDTAPTGWAAWQAGALRSFTFPAIGDKTVIPWSLGPMGYF